MLTYQNQDIKNLGELFSCHIYRNGRKHILISIQITIFASTSFLGGLWNGRFIMHQQDVRRPFLSIHIMVYFILYSSIGLSLFTSVAKMIFFCSSTDMP